MDVNRTHIFTWQTKTEHEHELILLFLYAVYFLFLFFSTLSAHSLTHFIFASNNSVFIFPNGVETKTTQQRDERHFSYSIVGFCSIGIFSVPFHFQYYYDYYINIVIYNLKKERFHFIQFEYSRQ